MNKQKEKRGMGKYLILIIVLILFGLFFSKYIFAASIKADIGTIATWIKPRTAGNDNKNYTIFSTHLEISNYSYDNLIKFYEVRIR